MTMTQPRTEGAVAPARAPRRPLTSRLSTGHLVMIVAGLVAAVGNYALLRGFDGVVTVAVAAVPLDAGQPVDASAFETAEVRIEDDLLGALLQPSQLAAVEGHVVVTPLAAGDPVRRTDLQPPSAPGSQRAMSIPIEAEHAVAGALAVGDRIDVIEVHEDGSGYLVTDAEVLAVPSTDSRQGITGLQSFSVTIAVDDTTALRLAVAIRNGQLEVVRSTGAAAVTETEYADPRAGSGNGSGGSEPEEE